VNVPEGDSSEYVLYDVRKMSSSFTGATFCEGSKVIKLLSLVSSNEHEGRYLLYCCLPSYIQ